MRPQLSQMQLKEVKVAALSDSHLEEKREGGRGEEREERKRATKWASGWGGGQGTDAYKKTAAHNIH